MTKEITKAFILQQMQDKFGLREFEAAKFLFSEQVIPVYEIGGHINKFFIQKETVSITSGAPTGFLFFTVPENERWTFTNYNITFMTGTYTVTGVYIVRISSGTVNSLYLDQVLGRSGSYAINLATPVVLESGDSINILVDGYSVTGDLRLTVDTMMEEIR